MKLVNQLYQNFPACAITYCFFHIIPVAFRVEGISPENRNVLGLVLKCGCAATTIDISHPEALNVISAPLPALFLENFSIISRNFVPLHVTVKDSQLESSAFPKNGFGLPSPFFFAAIFSHRTPDFGFPGTIPEGLSNDPTSA
jgi:hypothetical protein